MAEILLKAEIRSKSTKKSLLELRKSRKLPAVVYGGKGSNLSVVVSASELMNALKAGGANAIIHLKHSKGEDTVILKALERHAVTSQPIHADFQRISLKEKIEVKVPLRVVGEAPGVKLHGGVLEHILRDLKVRCLPNAIPQRIDVDVSSLEVGQNIAVSALKAPPEVEILEDAGHIVVNVVHVKEEAAPAPAAEAAVAEPEVITKGKKEEGEEGAPAKAEGAKPEAAKAAGKPEAAKPAQPAAGKKEEPKK